jgi:hypothetical protein
MGSRLITLSKKQLVVFKDLKKVLKKDGSVVLSLPLGN